MCVKNKYMMKTLSNLTDYPSEGNSQEEILGFQVIYFQERDFVYWQYCRKVRLMLQRNQMFIMCLPGGYSVVYGRPESQYFIFDMDVIAFNGTMFWRAQLASLSVMDIIVDCGMILLFLCRI